MMNMDSVFSCPEQLNRWPCPLLGWLVPWLGTTNNQRVSQHYRVTQETCDLWDIWSDRFLEDFHFSKIFRCLRDNNSNKDNPRTCDTSDADYNSDNWEPELRNSASSFHWLSSSIFSVCCLFVVRPASVTPPLISTLWRFRPYKLYIFCEDMILATCQCHSLLSWAQFTVV